MRTYNNDPELKARLIREMREHRDAERLIQGVYWSEDAREGCAVGCLSKDPEGGHEACELEFGIPEWLLHLEDIIFEGLAKELSQEWPERFLEAVPVGVDFETVKLAKHRFLAWLSGPDSPSAAANLHESVADCGRALRVLHERAGAGEVVGDDEWEAAEAAVAVAWAWGVIADRLILELSAVPKKAKGQVSHGRELKN